MFEFTYSKSSTWESVISSSSIFYNYTLFQKLEAYHVRRAQKNEVKQVLQWWLLFPRRRGEKDLLPGSDLQERGWSLACVFQGLLQDYLHCSSTQLDGYVQMHRLNCVWELNSFLPLQSYFLLHLNMFPSFFCHSCMQSSLSSNVYPRANINICTVIGRIHLPS